MKNFYKIFFPSGQFSTMQKCLYSHRYYTGHSSRRDDTPVPLAFSCFKTNNTDARKPPVVIMHGLLGSKNNWRSLSKVISQKTGRTVYSLDVRNHGDSPHTDVFNYYAMSNDIRYFLNNHDIERACLIGHSMGGRAMMAAALTNPSIVEKLFNLDISPIGTSDSAKQTIPTFIDVMLKTDIPSHMEIQQARKYVDEILKPLVPEIGIRMFLVSNLMKKEEQFTWKTNLKAISDHFHQHLINFPLAEEKVKFEGTTYFIGGELSDYIRKEDHDLIRDIFPKAKFYYLEGAGHWLHSDKPQEFLNLILPLINTESS